MAAYLFQPTVSTPSYDYSGVYGNISTYLNQIENELEDIRGYLATMAANSTIMATSQTTIADKQTAMETYQKRVKELGEGPGFRIKSPYELFQTITIWKLLIEEAKVLELEDVADGEKERALRRAIQYMREIDQRIPKEF